MKQESVYLTDEGAQYDGDEPAAQFATHRLNLRLDIVHGVHGNDKTKRKAVEQILTEENRKPRTNARITGLGSL